MLPAEAIFAIERLENYLKARFPASAGSASDPVDLVLKLLDKLPAEPGAVIRCEVAGCGKEAPFKVLIERAPDIRRSTRACEEHGREMVAATHGQFFSVSVVPPFPYPPEAATAPAATVPLPPPTLYVHFSEGGEAFCGKQGETLTESYTRVTCPLCADKLTHGDAT